MVKLVDPVVFQDGTTQATRGLLSGDTITADQGAAGSDPWPVDLSTLPTGEYGSVVSPYPAPMIGVALPSATGPVPGGTADNPIRTDPTGVTTQPVFLTGTSTAVSVNVADGSSVALGAKADSAASSDTGTFSLIALVKRLLGKLSDGTQQTKLTNGTNIADVQAIATGQNALGVVGGYKEVTFSTSSAVAVASGDVSPYRWVSVHVAAQGTNSVVTFQASNDNTNWTSLVLVGAAVASTGAQTVSTTSVGIWHGPVAARFFRLNVTGISAGTTSGVIELYTMPGAAAFAGFSTAQAGAWNVGTAAVATGGYTKQRYSAQTTTVQTLKGTAGKLGGWMLYNPNATVAYVQLFDVATATTVTLGTTAPDQSWAIPAGGAANLLSDTGIDFANGIKLACTTTATGLTAPTTGLDLNFWYK